LSSHDDSPASWPLSAARGVCIGLDIGIHADNAFMTIGGVWPHAGRLTIGVVDMKMFELNTPLEEVADHVAAVARGLPNPLICFDASQNSAFSGVLANRFGKPQNHLIACTITAAHEHAAQPQLMPISLHGQRAAIRRWGLSKKQLVEELAAEIEANSIRFAQAGDWEVMRDQLVTLNRTVRQSGAVTYSAAPGQHDDGPMSASLLLFGLRYAFGLGLNRRRVARPRQPAPGPMAWT
jgi:hypothetical protein